MLVLTESQSGAYIGQELSALYATWSTWEDVAMEWDAAECGEVGARYKESEIG